MVAKWTASSTDRQALDSSASWVTTFRRTRVLNTSLVSTVSAMFFIIRTASTGY